MSMTAEQVKDVLRRVVGEVAPEANLDAIAPDEPIREQLDLDSLDFLNVVIGIHEATGIDVPEIDYPRLATLDGCVAYLVAASRAETAEVGGP